MVLVLDPGRGERRLQACGISPRVFAAADAAALAHVEQHPNAGVIEGLEERRQIPAVDPDGDDPPRGQDVTSPADDPTVSGQREPGEAEL